MDSPLDGAEHVGGGAVNAVTEALVIVRIPFSRRQVFHIGIQTPIGDNISQLDAVTIFALPIGGLVVVQVDKADSSVNFRKSLIGHVTIEAVLKKHGEPDQRLGTRMPVGLGSLVPVSFCLVLNQRLVDGLGEFEV